MKTNYQKISDALGASAQLINRSDLGTLAFPCVRNHLALKSAAEPMNELLRLAQERVKAERTKYTGNPDAEIDTAVMPVVNEENAKIEAASRAEIDFAPVVPIKIDDILRDRDIKGTVIVALYEVGVLVE